MLFSSIWADSYPYMAASSLLVKPCLYLLSFMMYSSQSKPLLPLARWLSVMLIGQITHLWRRLPMKSWRPMRAKTLRQKTVRIITSESFFTDWIRAPTMVFRPGEQPRTHVHKPRR